MITAVRFDEAGIHFRNRYVATPSYRDETQGRPHPQSRLRQDAAGRRIGQRAPPAGKRVQHRGRPGERSPALAVGRRPALRARSGDAGDPGRGRFRRRAESLLRPSQGRSRQRRDVQLRHRLRAKDHAHALPHRQGRGHPPAGDHAALSADEPRLRADQEPSGVLPRPDPGPLAADDPGLLELRRRAALGRRQADADHAGAARWTCRAPLHRDRRLLPVPFRQRL